MSTIDVSDLAREELATAKFPVEYRAPFRLFLDPDVHRGIQAHAKEDASVEICGVLVGRWGRDELGPFAEVTDYIRCDSASSKFAEVTFTHESWAQINQQMDTKFVDKRIIGWYHSHPDFGIFLSDRDCFIHEHFFSGAGQVAYVVDPVRDLEGVFDWQAGKPTPMSHYWVGSQIRTVEASQRNPAREAAARAGGVSVSRAGEAPDGAPTSIDRSSFGATTNLLAWLALFLLGYMLAGARTRWEQERLVEGTVAHFGVTKILKDGLDPSLAKVRRNLQAIGAETKKLPAPNATLSEEEAATALEQQQTIADSLATTERMLADVQSQFALSAEERVALAKFILQKQAEAAEMLTQQGASATSAKPKEPAATGPAALPPDKPVDPLPAKPAADAKPAAENTPSK
ncbi:Mov34/MPN/PAD-1 family protein [Lacipirellula limnantheis]|uniref:Mov34/MPN/PAD-1 family protein n=1 Tax=Lacipirellula limnantheis TaxID=2528024 RepID=A0A517U1X1_9BACT|nr:Mov34/MPN/PAD-1 family protein [Lacipirellula limnantheis]QDT74635.1 Mov34/MPN/PAD-1 family protein [Lacipirellula limnantheis]